MQDLVIDFKDDGSHLYEQIYNHMKDEIRKGKLLYREKLPSTRSLAAYLQVSRSTVELAYEQLLSEGYIESVPYKGYFVAQVEELYRIEENAGRKERISKDQKEKYMVDFSPNAIDMSHFPFGIWRRITKNILSQDKKETFFLGEAKGDLRLRETIVRYLHASRGVNADASQVIVGAGNDYLLMLLEKILGRHVPIAMENPTYKRAYRVFQSFAYEIKALPMDKSGISVKALEQSNARVAYIMPSHQYPTGVVMPIGRRMELLKWAEQGEDRYLIEDDYDSEFRYKGKPIPALQASDRTGKVIYIGTFSKSIAPAIRVGYMVLPGSLMEKYRQSCGFYASTVSRIDQRILNEFIKDGYFERYLNKMRKIYKEKHDFLLEQLKGMEKDFILSGENAGLHVLLTSKRKIPEKDLIQSAAEKKIRIYGLSDAMVGVPLENGKYENTILLGYGALSQEEINQGIRLLKEAWKEYLH